MKGWVLLLLLFLLSNSLMACQWAERVVVNVRSDNFRPIEGAEVSVHYQRNVVGMKDTVESKLTDENGVAIFFLCDSAPYDIIKSYDITVEEPFQNQKKQFSERYSLSHGGVNQVDVFYDFPLYNLSILVEDEDGDSVAFANISIESFRLFNVIADWEGKASVLLPPDTYSLSCVIGNSTSRKNISLDGDINVSLTPPPKEHYSVNLTILDDALQPIQNATVNISYAEDNQSHEISLITDEQGVVILENITSSSMNVSVSFESVTTSSHFILSPGMNNFTVNLDIHAPIVKNVLVTYKNIGILNETYEIMVLANVSDTSPMDELTVVLHYSSPVGKDSSLMNLSGGLFSTTVVIDEKAPFTFTYWLESSDPYNNTAISGNFTKEILYVPSSLAPPPTPTPSEPLSWLLDPISSFLSSVSEYMWALILLVLIVLGGTLLVFLAFMAFLLISRRK